MTHRRWRFVVALSIGVMVGSLVTHASQLRAAQNRPGTQRYAGIDMLLARFETQARQP